MNKSIKNPKGSGSKPKLEVTEKMIEEVKKLSGEGLNLESIWDYYGICSQTWYNYCKKYPELKKAAARGKAKMVSFVAGALIRQVKKGNTTAMIFYLKTQGRFSEYNNLKITTDGDKPAAPSLTINVTDPIEAAKLYQQIMLGS